MNSSRWAGLMVGTLFLIGTLILFGSTVHSAWYKIPLEAVNGIAFTLAFGLGLNHFFAYVSAFITLAALFYIGYAIGSRIFNKIR
ncbi:MULTISPECIES: hypothetical protein [Vibrio]|jgi:hypothetical protein|uniref:Uncharacterized protein n=1 Tax=Vibrio rotiferianus TaxID=190895 RepID=A0A2K7SPR0_9VIBR|nr:MULTISPECIES: hypothetical protein [Vibrio]ASI94569.1 hypothetical protein BSZ04_06050 [Vibrio rotiferianus]MDK9776858.1 hypothetical protein [Vibrio sp. D401a]MDK9808422.1 hypothetical protein [Vibrio sp. D406a]NOH50149.1 hypothetical protein [Vibrio rotiferianus]OHY89139.1 hypothetical protein BI375_09915 [Vibrio rotiferianus]